MRSPIRSLAIAGLLLAATASMARADPIAVITGPAARIDGVRALTLRRIYLGKISRLGGVPAEPVHLGSGSPARGAFSLAILGRSEEELQEYWIEQALRGGRLPPRELPSAAAVIEYVGSRPAAVGYVPLSALGPGASVRVLRILERGRSLGPRDPGYPLRTP